MMSNNRAEYGSAAEWLAALRKDDAWLHQLKQLETSADGDIDANREAAIRRIGRGETFEFWDIYQHEVEPVVAEVWEIAELTLPKLKIQAIGMLSMEWLEQHANNKQSSDSEVPADVIVGQLKPIFYGSEEEAKAFLQSIQGMKPTQITNKVNQLVSQKKISDMSKNRDLWRVLHDFGIYNKTESNWNQQVN